MISMRRVLHCIAGSLVILSVLVSTGLAVKPQSTKQAAHESQSMRDRRVPALPTERATTNSLDEVVLSEDFELVSLGGLPTGWRQVDGDGGYCTWFERASTWQTFSREYFSAHSGTRLAMCHFNDGDVPNDDWLILPRQNLSGTITLRYWAASQDEQYPESFEVRVSTTGSAPANFTHLVHSTASVPPVWTEYVHDLSAFAGTPVYIAFHYNSVGRFALKVDDVSLEAAGSATGVLAGTVTDDSLHSIYGATARILSPSRSARTDSAGIFHVTLLPAGVYNVQVFHEFYEPKAATDLTVAVNETTWTDVSLTPLPLNFHDYPCWNPDQPILDLDTAVMWINIPDTLVIYDIDVTVTINHSYVGDLDVWLKSPDTTIVQLVMHDPYNSGQNIIDCRFDDEALLPFAAGTAPYNGSWQPFEPLANYNGDSTLLPRGEIRYRTWSLLVYDNDPADEGFLRDFSLRVAEGVPLSVPDNRPRAPRAFSFDGNYPNPFNSRTQLRFTLNRTGEVELTVFDLTGRRVAVLAHERMESGVHVVPFDASALPSGIYFAQLRVSGVAETRKMILLR